MGKAAHSHAIPRVDIRDALTAAIASAFSIPISLAPVMGYETNPVFMLSPVVAIAFISTAASRLNIAFLVATICGMASIAAAEWVHPDGRFLRNVLSLLLLLFSASFFFLGRSLTANRDKLFFWLAALSSLFIIAATARLMILGGEVRAITADEFVYLDAQFLWFPSFARFGVNSLANLICIQSALIVGAMFSAKSPKLITLFSVALTCALYLIIESESRSSQVFILILYAGIGIYVYRTPSLRRRSILAVVALAISAAPLLVNAPSSTRLARSMSNISGDRMNEVASGRVAIYAAAVDEFIKSPIFGTGFAPFGRISAVSNEIRSNSSAHMYPLTILWKGGLLFAVPFFSFLAAATLAVVRGHAWRSRSSNEFFAIVAVAGVFFWLSIWWDIPIVPSAGALAFLLAGVLSTPPQNHTPTAL